MLPVLRVRGSSQGVGVLRPAIEHLAIADPGLGTDELECVGQRGQRADGARRCTFSSGKRKNYCVGRTTSVARLRLITTTYTTIPRQ